MDYNWDIGGNKSPVTNQLANPMVHLSTHPRLTWYRFLIVQGGAHRSIALRYSLWLNSMVYDRYNELIINNVLFFFLWL